MIDFFDEVNGLVGDILSHEVDCVKAKERISELKKKYGQDAFPSIYFKKKNKPWDKAYLRELKEKNTTGACSEEFLVHMAEVSDYLSKKKDRKFIIGIVAGATIVLLIILVIIFRR
ncbi:MAG TPA: hypothetical protein DCX57_09310 [Lachnospiraceae bacterium]|nr:hypothetical protein [Lachnospiraceae bacterium]